MKTKKKTLLSFSDNRISFYMPTNWEALSEPQLRYVFRIGEMYQDIALKTLCLIRFLNIKVHKKTKEGWLCSTRVSLFKRKRFFLQTFEIDSFIRQLAFLDEIGSAPFNLSKIGRFRAIDLYFHQVPFKDYINIENYYQGYLYTRDKAMVTEMSKLMYVNKRRKHPKKIRLSSVEILAVVMWYAALKNHFANKFSYFFQRVEADHDLPETEAPDMEAVMNAEIRALTGGDIVKEEAVLEMDVWRALTELNEKAREIKPKKVGLDGH